MRLFKTAWFGRFAEKNCIADNELKIAASEIEAGQVEADLGGGVFKKRVARSGEGKSGAYRDNIMDKKYQSELLGAIHEEAMANYEAGAIDKERLITYDEACLVHEDPVSAEAINSFAVLSLEHKNDSLQTSNRITVS